MMYFHGLKELYVCMYVCHIHSDMCSFDGVVFRVGAGLLSSKIMTHLPGHGTHLGNGKVAFPCIPAPVLFQPVSACG